MSDVQDAPLSLWKHTPVRVMPTLREMAEDVERRHGCSVSTLKGESRLKPIVLARQEFMWMARRVTYADGSQRYSLPQIGAFLGGRDHSTVLHGVRAHERRVAEK